MHLLHLIGEKIFDHAAEGVHFKQKGIVSVSGVDVAVRDFFAVAQQSSDKFVRVRRREKPVA